MFQLILKCILFSFLCTIILLLWSQPQETQLFVKEIISPLVYKIYRRILKTFWERQPVIYDLTNHIIQYSSSKSCYENLHSFNKTTLMSLLNASSTWTDDECLTTSHKQLHILSNDMKQAYQRDGVVAIRGLISPQLLKELNHASQVLIAREKDRVDIKGREYSTGKQFQTKTMSPILDLDANLNGFRHAALYSLLPQVVAELLGVEDSFDTDRSKNTTATTSHTNNNVTNIRILRDVFLAKDEGQYYCGWHVDDWGFWPASASSDGVNAWIAIDDMPESTGGGFALSVGSHRADWRYEAYEIIGATPTIPQDGFQSAEDMFRNRKGAGTCNLKNSSPQVNQLLEDNMRVYNVKAGDVIFHTRWLFHRTIPFHPKIVREYYYNNHHHHHNNNKHPPKMNMDNPSMMIPSNVLDPLLLYRRYTIRYAPGYATLPKGYVTELSILWNKDNAGRTLDDVSMFDGPWYPKCYPSIDIEEISQFQNLIETKLPIAITKRKERYKEMKPFLHEIGQKQRDMLRMNSHGIQTRKQERDQQQEEEQQTINENIHIVDNHHHHLYTSIDKEL